MLERADTHQQSVGARVGTVLLRSNLLISDIVSKWESTHGEVNRAQFRRNVRALGSELEATDAELDALFDEYDGDGCVRRLHRAPLSGPSQPSCSTQPSCPTQRACSSFPYASQNPPHPSLCMPPQNPTPLLMQSRPHRAQHTPPCTCLTEPYTPLLMHAYACPSHTAFATHRALHLHLCAS